MPKKHWLKTSIIGLTFCVMTPLSFASGSGVVGAAQTGERAAYNKGKRVYAVKVVCDSCPMAGKKLNKETAKTLLMNGSGSDLTDSEQKALNTYLKRRFKL